MASTEASLGAPCAIQVTAEHDPRVIETRKVEKALQDKGLTSTHMDFSHVVHATQFIRGRPPGASAPTASRKSPTS